jgi:hypothetical protein
MRREEFNSEPAEYAEPQSILRVLRVLRVKRFGAIRKLDVFTTSFGVEGTELPTRGVCSRNCD